DMLGSYFMETMSKLKITLNVLTIILMSASFANAMWVMPHTFPSKETSVIMHKQEGSLERIAMRLFRTAIEKFDDKAHWYATRELIILLDFYPAFSKTDGVLYYLGESLYEMDMYKSASRMFRYLITTYPQSEYLPKTLLSLQKLHYNTQELENSLNYYVGITTRFPKDDVLDGSYYYGGMAFFHQKKYDDAIKALGRVRSRSDYYDYGLYTVGLCFLKKKIFNNRLKSLES
ncbi:MAG: tol-pal system YbgF family protein, partial [bacterium]